MKRGKLLLLPSLLGDESMETIPQYLIDELHSIRYLVAERAKTARRFLSKTKPPVPIQEYHIEELNKRTPSEEIHQLLDPLAAGHDVGLLSEAGCPGVADPGGRLVDAAHRQGYEVRPYVGPSSILLALMASGMNGQSFAFHGYLPPKRDALRKVLKTLERQSAAQTQIFIETPYRNSQIVEESLKTLNNQTRFCIAANLTTTEEWIRTKSIAEWKKTKLPDLKKVPCVFLIGQTRHYDI